MEPIFEAVLKGEGEVGRLLRVIPRPDELALSEDFLVTTISHWLYAGDTSLHLAAAGLWTKVARLLLESGADPNAQNRRGATPLHYACDPRPKSGGIWNPTAQASLIDVLVTHGAEIDRCDRGGATALHRAVRARSVAAVRQLLALGARTDGALRKRVPRPSTWRFSPRGPAAPLGRSVSNSRSSISSFSTGLTLPEPTLPAAHPSTGPATRRS